MIYSVSASSFLASNRFAYTQNLPFFKREKIISFSPGLNIIFGPNASGKSTLLRGLALHLAAEQGGASCVTQDYLRTTVDLFAAATSKGSKSLDELGLHVEHDGKPIQFLDPRVTVGITSGAFDNDFFNEGLRETIHRKSMSSGEKTLSRLGRVVSVLTGESPMPTQVEYKVSAKVLNSTWAAGLAIVKERFKATAPEGPATILLDEPESGLGLPLQARLWELLARHSGHQLIVASHSPFALGLPEANYIETSLGYAQQAKAELSRFFSSGSGDPAPLNP